MSDFLTGRSGSAIPLTAVTSGEYGAWLEAQPARVRTWLEASAFKGKAGSMVRIPDEALGVSQVVVGVEDPESPWGYGDLPAHAATQAAIGWGLGTYAFDRYKQRDKAFATLVWPEQADRDHALRTIEAVFLARDLINTPANDLGPAELEDAARALAKKHKAKINTIVGDDLLKQNYPTIHMVGRGSVRAPRLIDIRWGKAGAPRVTLVGKGVCFDTGGYDLKPSSGMLNMKKDMGGAANILGLAHMVMAAKLPVRLRVLIPAVENSVSGNAMRPRDIVKTRKGITVEIGNTDAEGRLVLCDPLADADDEKPDLREADPMWRLPLWDGYRKNLDSDIADMNNVSEGGFGGAITAALYLQAFVSKETKWAHVDMFAWNQGNRPGRPKGGEAQFIRAAFGYLRERYA